MICVLLILLSLVKLEKFRFTAKDLKQIAKGRPSTGLILPTLTHYDIHLLWTTIRLCQTTAFFDPTNHLHSSFYHLSRVFLKHNLRHEKNNIFKNRITSDPGVLPYGGAPQLHISHSVMPKPQTSDFELNVP